MKQENQFINQNRMVLAFARSALCLRAVANGFRKAESIGKSP